MTPGRLTEGLAAAARVRRDDLLDLAEQLASSQAVAVVEPPRGGTVMVELESPVGPFCFTEAVVTTALVTVDEREGWGCVLGWDEEGALAAALLDAAGAEAAAQLAEAALEDERGARELTQRAVAATRVGQDG